MHDCLKRNKLVCFQTKTNLRQRTLHFKLHYGLILVQDNAGLTKESVNCEGKKDQMKESIKTLEQLMQDVIYCF